MKCVLDMFIYDIDFVIYVIYSNGISFFFFVVSWNNIYIMDSLVW